MHNFQRSGSRDFSKDSITMRSSQIEPFNSKGFHRKVFSTNNIAIHDSSRDSQDGNGRSKNIRIRDTSRDSMDSTSRHFGHGSISRDFGPDGSSRHFATSRDFGHS